MNTYELGAADDEVGALVITPGTMLDEMETVNSAVRELRNAIALSNVRKEFKSAYEVFVAEWQRFYGEHLGWLNRMWGATYEKILDFRRRVDEWHEAFIREGGNPAAPAVVSSDKHSWMGPALWMIGAGVGAWALSSIATMTKR